MAEPQDILIDLTRSGDATRFDFDKTLIQQEAKDRVIERINAVIGKIDEFLLLLRQESKWVSDYYRPRHHDVITIHGHRGSGKTTFILSLFEHLKSDPKIEILRVIDPTLIESKENILISIISLIKRKVEEHMTDYGHDDKERRTFDEKLRGLARGLQLLDSIGPDKLFGEDWSDAEWILESGLKNARSGTDFEANFHAFIDSSLRILGKKAFLLAFDDIDTSFERGWPVLETIRKHLTTPQLIVLLSGDLELYARLVRQRQFQNLGDVVLQYDRPNQLFHPATNKVEWREDRIVNMINVLEDQYLLKIMKPENRVGLMTLDHYLRALSSKYRICIQTNGESDEKTLPTLSSFMDDTLAAHLFLDRRIERIDIFRNVILRQPVRTAVSFLIAAHAAKKGDTGDFLGRLTEIGAAALFHMDLSPEDIHSADGPTLMWRIVKWLDDNQLWDEGYRLIPNHLNEDVNMVTLVLGGRLAGLLQQSPDVALLQILHINLIRELKIAHWPRDQRPTDDDIRRYLDLEHVEKPSTTARRTVAAIRSLRDGESFRHQIFAGTAPITGARSNINAAIQSLYLLDDKNEFKSLEDELDERIPDEMREYWEKAENHLELDHTNPWHHQVTFNSLLSAANGLGDLGWMINLPASITPDPTNRQTTFYSIYSLLGVLAELMGLESIDRNVIKSSLERLGQRRTYPLPSWALPYDVPPAKSSQYESENTEEDYHEESSDNEFFIDALFQWLSFIRSEDQRNKTVYHPHVIARIGTRFYYTLQRFDEESTGSDQYLGNLMHRQIVAFLNAVLVEERLALDGAELASEEFERTSIDFTNPTINDGRFLRNIPKILSSGSKDRNSPHPKRINNNGAYNIDILRPQACPLFNSYLSCPLFSLFVSTYSEMKLGSADINWNLLEVMQNSWKAWADPETQMNIAAVTEVTFQFRSRSKSKPTETFANLHPILNSIPILFGSGME